MSKAHKNSSWLFGHHAVTSALENPRRQLLELLVVDKNLQRYRQLADRLAVRVRVVSRDQLDRMTQQPHQGVALQVQGSGSAEASLEDLFESKLIVALDQVTDPHNVGACLRSANAMGASAVLVTERRSAVDSPIIAKAAAGAMEDTPLVVVANLAQAIERLQKEGFWSVGLAGEATQELGQIDLTGKIILVMGSEGEGLRRLVREKCDYLAKLPMVGTVESLNVSVATGISLYEVTRQRQNKR